MADEQYVVELRVDLKAGNIGSQLANELAQARQGADDLDKNLDKVERGLSNLDDAGKKATQSLSTTRYALYDVSSTATMMGTVMVGLATAIYAVGIAWERDFANVVRTADLNGDVEDIAKLREQFVELNQTLPVTASTLAEIGALGGQLGIDSSGLQSFTTVVAQLTATTDLSAEAAGTALGRFQALLGVPSSEFENLASSILKVGINSVATETQIVNIATQISSMGSFAGLTADQVVGLSGALASVGAQPEISRGTVTRTFTLMSRAIAQGGEKLDKFAQISGMSADQFKSTWGTPQFSATFQKFLKGIDAEGGNAVAALNELGITSVRDVPLLLRLAGASDVVAKSFADAATGYKDNTELANQYGIIAETMAAKLQLLLNNFQQFLVALADGGVIFGGAVDVATDFLKILTDIAENPVGGFFLQFGVIAMGVIGVLLLVVGAVTRTAAGMIAMNQAMVAANGTMLVTSGNAARLTASFIALGFSEEAAAKGATRLSTALKLITFVGIAAGVFAVVPMIKDSLNELAGQTDQFGAVAKRLGDNGATAAYGISLMAGSSKEAKKALEGINLGQVSELAENLGKLQDQMVLAAESGDVSTLASQFAVLQKETGWEPSALLKALPKLKQELDDTGVKVKFAKDGTAEFVDAAGKAIPAIEGLTSETDALALANENLATQLGLVPEELAALQKNLTTGSAGFVQFGDLIQRVQDKTKGWAEAESKSKYDSKDSWQEWYDGSSVDIYAFMDLLDQQIASQGVWADNMKQLTAMGANAFVTELAKMGPEGAPLAAAAVNLTADELGKLEEKAALAAFLASEAFANTFTAQTPMLIAAYAAGGIEAVQGMIAAQRQESIDKTPGAVAAFVSNWNSTYAANPIKMPVDANTDPANQRITSYISATNGKRITLYVDAVAGRQIANGPGGSGGQVIGKASGGYISGPGTGTSDSIPARLSNGEYVVKAASVAKVGTGFMNALNRGQVPQAYASGGQVGASTSSSMIGGVTEFGPQAMAAIRGIAQSVNITLDDMAIARAANRGNKVLAGNGAMQ